MDGSVACPVCNREFRKDQIEDHVNKCLFLNTQPEKSVTKRTGSFFNSVSPKEKRIKTENSLNNNAQKYKESSNSTLNSNGKEENADKSVPLAEQMRPLSLDDIVGHKAAFGAGTMLRSMLEQNKIPNMILWGPPGCGKTSMANVIAQICKKQKNMRFVKMSATMSGINDVKEVVKIAKNEAQFKRQTVLFMDEIHRFNKLQQDSFLPHVENGTIILIGATTENPSFSLNNALLSRCKVVVMEKLTVEDVMLILERAVAKNKEAVLVDTENKFECPTDGDIPRCLVERASLRWLAEVSDGDARVALGALELALTARAGAVRLHETGPALLTLDDIKDGIKRSHMLYDHHGEEHYNTISAIHKSIRAGDDNAALYWTTRALHGGEDPLYIARRLVRAACEDIGLADHTAIVEAVSCLQGCQHVGMPEADVLLAQCAVRLARAPKSREVYVAMQRCQRSLKEAKGPLPPIPLHLRNPTTKLMKDIGYGKGYNLRHKDESGLTYMPEGMEDVDFFRDDESRG
ncbi:ATPase WRNIP1-like isoform X2 [Leguminivora glycinivorella]|uniref:ATPase WRNIP1-like isoform X2 n=1 Tax=Leguminivora glycinivorella TaxID=1035111 RepID=UPI00200D9D2C|nr:ATPase WRNIP1-like isoform X2 [Leguminivora glycinivorella]